MRILLKGPKMKVPEPYMLVIGSAYSAKSGQTGLEGIR